MPPVPPAQFNVYFDEHIASDYLSYLDWALKKEYEK
jgi:hypothetical protein